MYACAMMLLRDEDEAADCVQDALIRLWESRSRLAEIEKPEAYCLTAVKRQALDAIRRRGRMQESNVDISNIDLPGSLTPHDEAVARDDLRLACQLIGQLAPRQRDQEVERIFIDHTHLVFPPFSENSHSRLTDLPESPAVESHETLGIIATSKGNYTLRTASFDFR